MFKTFWEFVVERIREWHIHVWDSFLKWTEKDYESLLVLSDSELQVVLEDYMMYCRKWYQLQVLERYLLQLKNSFLSMIELWTRKNYDVFTWKIKDNIKSNYKWNSILFFNKVWVKYDFSLRKLYQISKNVKYKIFKTLFHMFYRIESNLSTKCSSYHRKFRWKNTLWPMACRWMLLWLMASLSKIW